MTHEYRLNSETWFQLREESIAILRTSARPKDTVSEYPFSGIKSIRFANRKTYYFFTLLMFILIILINGGENPYVGDKRGMYITMYDGAEVFVDLDNYNLKKALLIHRRTLNRVRRHRKGKIARVRRRKS